MSRARLGLPIALVAVVVVAEGAVLLLRPRAGVIEPAPVSVGRYFTPAQVQKARDYGRPQLALYGASVLVEGALLIFLIRRPPRALRRRRRRPVLAGAAAGAALSAGLTLATLPIGAVMRQRSLDVGLATQAWGDWAVDVGKSLAIGGALAGAGAALLLGLQRRVPRHWWAPASAGVVAVGAAFLYAGPVVLDPIFNRFTALPPGQTRSDVLELARQAGVKVGQVYESDASRRTTAANAYVTGLGSTKRVVIYDTLLKNFTRDETRLVVAHELGHVHYDDVPRGLLFLALVAPFGMFAVQRLSGRFAPGAQGTAAVLPAVVLSLALVSGAVTTISNQLSRRVEARADTFSLQLTHAPEPFISFERRIALRNLSDPDPPKWIVWLLSTHPPTIERIGTAVAFERGAR
ncbi:MAG: endopeptidase [Solirubrobacteraceae bacterium]|nr:endopeptidase [Solirubrobacteraceae bacterium]